METKHGIATLDRYRKPAKETKISQKVKKSTLKNINVDYSLSVKN